ncbi:MAG TPA: tetratricopeptide repeat protein [bacterium]|jgi:tetratricopeptide (TPR) repeat protein|nr:tetratricopeptide repeat protein [bacterium]
MRVISNRISKFGLWMVFGLFPAIAGASSAQYLAYGNQLLRQNRYDQANQYFSAVAKAEPRNPEAYKGLGYVAMAKNQPGAAIKDLEYALALSPSDQGLRHYLGTIYQRFGNEYFAKGNKDAALAWWHKAVTVDPSNRTLATYLASLQSAPAPVAAAQGPRPIATQAPASQATPGFNPWIMGCTVAVLGAVMLFIF